MLAAFWDDVRDHATLLSLSSLQRCGSGSDAAISAGKTKLPPRSARALPPAVADAESHRLIATMTHGSSSTEAAAAFVAQANEQAIRDRRRRRRRQRRIDRIDALSSGGLAIVDYKSGRVRRTAALVRRAAGRHQLAVYAHAVEHAAGAPLRALAFAQLKAGRDRSQGLVDGPDVWPGLDIAGASRVPVQDWADAQAT